MPVPYMRGDEPPGILFTGRIVRPFPTCVGMNRPLGIDIFLIFAVPYMRGDEPKEKRFWHTLDCRSLHAWG